MSNEKKLPTFDETIEKATKKFRPTTFAPLIDSETTLCVVKPDAIKHVDEILKMLEGAGLKVGDKVESMTLGGRVNELYSEHVGKPWYEEHRAFMTCGPVVAFTVTGPNAIARLRELAGATDPRKAIPGTIRARFGTDLPRNAIHASDSPVSAAREIAILFP